MLLRRLALPLAASALIATSLALDFTVIGRSLSEKGVPDHSLAYLVRMGMVAVAAALLVLWLETRAEPRSDSGLCRPSLRVLLYAGLPLLAAVAFLALLVRNPYLFYRYAREDALVETAQVGMLLLAAGLFAYCSRCLLASRARRSSSTLAALVALGLLLVALEELSWGQRLFGLKAAGPFISNPEGETNLHNFATHDFELVYYFGIFVALVALPYLGERTELRSPRRWLGGIVPSTAVLMAAAPAVAFNYGEWGQLTTQFAVWTTLAILVAHLARAARVEGRMSLITAAVVLAGFVAIQAALLIQGDAMLRWWQNTEYKELLGTLALLLWAVEVTRRSQGRAGI